jgi:hypothetical protein
MSNLKIVLADLFITALLYYTFQVLTAVRAFWDVITCSIVGIDRRFGDTYCLRHHGDE